MTQKSRMVHASYMRRTGHSCRRLPRTQAACSAASRMLTTLSVIAQSCRVVAAAAAAVLGLISGAERPSTQ
jgi:hypothetical protein